MRPGENPPFLYLRLKRRVSVPAGKKDKRERESKRGGGGGGGVGGGRE